MPGATEGVVLMNLGSPDSTSIPDIKKYLDEFLMDGRVIDSPYLIRFMLVKGFIVPFRAPQSAEAYRSIWTEHGSPLIILTEQLKLAIEQQIPQPVSIAMRYGNPSPKAAFDELMRENPDLKQVTLVPLYPHYAMSSYETAVEYAKTIHKKGKYPFRLDFIKPFYDHADYIDALCDSMKPHLEQDYDHVLFSYHGIPEGHIYKGDTTGQHCLKVANCCETPSPAHKECYRHQCFTTTKLAAAQLNIPAGKFSSSFQSRLGRAEWLKPYTVTQLQEFPKQGIKKLVILCPAFVSDCLETLEEIAEEGREIFMHAGGESFTLIPCLNIHPLWVKSLATWLDKTAKGSKEMLLQ
ncbi:MAG: ferrochelatase [Sphingobacteriales bacterium]|nr:MAG: ferrochelatase [Sphingobacteriales bacterium]